MISPELTATLKIIKAAHSVSRDEVAKAIETLNDAEFRAALLAFREARISSVPRREVEASLTLLRDVYEKSVTGSKQFSFATFIPFVNYTDPPHIRAALRALYTALLISAYYSALEESRLVQEWLPKIIPAWTILKDRSLTLAQWRHAYSSSIMLSEMDKCEVEMRQIRSELDACISKMSRGKSSSREVPSKTRSRKRPSPRGDKS